MSHDDTLAALRRHFAIPEPREHDTFSGGISFLDGGALVTALDEQVLQVLNERGKRDADVRRKRLLDVSLRGSPSPDALRTAPS